MLDPNLSFEHFVVGPANELAATAARRTAEAPGSVYSPLVISGGPGVGKTHLLHAIGLYANVLEPDIAFHIETADVLAQLFSQGVANGDLDTLVYSLSRLDLLLIDDIDQLRDRERTQDELASIALRMADEGRQVVMTSAASPLELPGFVSSFKEVLGRGVVVELGVPDEETRRSLAERVATDRRQPLTVEVLRAIAKCEFPDVPSLRSAVNGVLDAAAAEGRNARSTDVLRVIGQGKSAHVPVDEFASFLNDVSRTLATVVETAPWRRRLAEAILRWEGEGIRTQRLERALLTDTAPDVETLIDEFSREATRLLHVRRDLSRLGVEELPDDPGDVERAEMMLAAAQSKQAAIIAQVRTPRKRAQVTVSYDGLKSAEAAKQRALPTTLIAVSRNAGGATAPKPGPGDDSPTDSWFLNQDKIVLAWADVDGRLIDSPR